jgi:hypothetical protein
MPPKNRLLLLAAVLIVLAGVLTVVFLPVIVSNGVRVWLSWKGRQQGLLIQINKIDAPFLRPVEIGGLHITSVPGAAFRIDVKAAQAMANLNLKAILLHRSARAIRTLSVEGLRVELRQTNAAATALTEAGWATLQKLLPDSFNLDLRDLRFEDPLNLLLLRGVSISGSQIEAGRFRAEEATIASPWFRQTFSKLLGATNWEDSRLTLSGLSLARGLDILSLTTDLSHLGKQSVRLDFDCDAFGGKIRAGISNDWHSHQSSWNIVGSVTDISLEQTSEALGFTDHVNGLLHACKFTFRGNSLNPARATASLWMELAGPTWRERSADVIMIGVALYNRQIDLQQLYVKQNKNQFTLSGEAALPTNSADWLQPDFHGDISASISDLGDFARLFGATPDDFAGQISIGGIVNAHAHKIEGHLTGNGASLKIFNTSIDSLGAKVNFKGTEIQLDQLELKNGNDFIRVQGTVDSATDHHYTGALSAAFADIAHYARMIPAPLRAVLSQGAVGIEWSGHGDANSHSGTFRVNGRGIRVSASAELSPFDAQLDGTYSPSNVFFRQLHLTNEYASLTGFATVASNYLQLQGLAFDLNGKPTLRGNIFLPLSLSKIFHGSSLLDALDPEQRVDLDLAMEQSDLTELSTALIGRAAVSGTFGARMSIFGGLDALQGWSELQLHDFAIPNDTRRVSGDAQTRFVSGMMNTKATVLLRNSDPILLNLNSQIYLGRERDRASLEPIAVEIDFPAIFLPQLPRYLSSDAFSDGILSGKMSISETPCHPKILGDVQLINGKFAFPGLPITRASGRLVFKGKTASLDFANLSANETDLSLHGDVDFRDPDDLSIRVSPSEPMVALSSNERVDCVSGLQLLPVPATEMLPAVERLTFRGSAFRSDWMVRLDENMNGRPFGPLANLAATRTFQFCSDAQESEEMLLLGCARRTTGETTRHRKPTRHR